MLRALTGLFATCRISVRASYLSVIKVRTSLLSTMGAPALQKVDTTNRLESLRKLMKEPEYDVTAYVIPSEDQRAYINTSRNARNEPLIWWG